MKWKRALWFILPLFLVRGAQAHCPLCTAGIAAAAGGAAYLGVNKAAIALFVGAFAVSTGWWVGGKIRKKIIPHQTAGIVFLSFLLTVLPLLPLLTVVYPWPVFIAGEYGSLLNRTYVINVGLVASILGGTIVSITPWLSRKISRLRNGRIIPFQGIALTLGLLMVISLFIQVVM